jgi:hypothetical protein
MLCCKKKLKQFLARYALVATLALVSHGAWAQTLHAIIVADTNDIAIGASKDEKDILQLVDDIRQNTCLQPQITTIDGAAVAQGGGGYDKVKSAIENLPVTPNDVVLFYYSGHGASPEDSPEPWPGLGVEGQTTPRSRWIKLAWVKDTLKQKNPRFFIAMADACNVFLSGGSRGHKPKGAQRSAYEQLFLGYSGYIVASSSIPEQYSFGGNDTGGLFTRQFLKSLFEGLNSPSPDWTSIMTQATQTIPISHPKQNMQQPQAEVQVTKSKGTAKNACSVPPTDPTFHPTPIQGGESEPPFPKKGTCADNVYYPKDGQRCCVSKGGKEHCYKK